MIGLAPLEIEIHPGEHPEGHLFGMTFNLDTIWVTVVAGAIVLGLGFWARAQLTKDTEDHVPTKLQLVWETVVNEVTTQVEGNLGKVNPFVVPLAVALFFFISGDLVSVFQLPKDAESQRYFFAGLGFLAGFSERFAQDMVAQGKSAGAAAPPMPSATKGA